MLLQRLRRARRRRFTPQDLDENVRGHRLRGSEDERHEQAALLGTVEPDGRSPTSTSNGPSSLTSMSASRAT